MADRLAREYAEGRDVREADGSWRDLSGFSCIQEKRAHGENAVVRKQLRESCNNAMKSACDALIEAEALDWEGASVIIINSVVLLCLAALPRSSTYEECVSFYCALQMCKGAIIHERGRVAQYVERLSLMPYTPAHQQEQARDVIARFSVLVDSTAAGNRPLVVARETPNASYFTMIGSSPNVVTCAIFREREMSMGSLLRCKSCKFDFAGDNRVELAASCIYPYSNSEDNKIKLWYAELQHTDDCFLVKRLLPVLANSLDDQFTNISFFSAVMSNVLVGQNIETALRGFNAGAPSPGMDLGADPVVAATNNVDLITSSNSNVPSNASSYTGPTAGRQIRMVNLESMFKGSYNLDAEYKRFCNPNAEAPVDSTTSAFERDMQIQERTLSLAAIMARRSYQGMSKRQFTNSMLETAQGHRGPMDLDAAIRAFSTISMQRGAGSWHSIIRAPESESEEEYMPVAKFVPVYVSVWDPLFHEGSRWHNAIDPI